MSYKILFFGTSEFACESLNILNKYHKILAVVSSPKPSPISLLTKQLGLKLLTPESPNSTNFITSIKQLKHDFLCLAAYGHILSGELINVPEIASINLHPSLLPAYRGAAPIQWAILNGDAYTGVTTFLMNEKIDCGKILLQKKVAINKTENYGELQARMSKTGARLFLETINKFSLITPTKQSGLCKTYAPKISKDMRRIDWNKDSFYVMNLIRALSPKPLAYTIFRKKRLEIIKAKSSNFVFTSGKIQCLERRVFVGTLDTSVELIIIKPEAKREQSAIDFINGYHPESDEAVL